MPFASVSPNTTSLSGCCCCVGRNNFCFLYSCVITNFFDLCYLLFAAAAPSACLDVCTAQQLLQLFHVSRPAPITCTVEGHGHSRPLGGPYSSAGECHLSHGALRSLELSWTLLLRTCGNKVSVATCADLFFFFLTLCRPETLERSSRNDSPTICFLSAPYNMDTGGKEHCKIKEFKISYFQWVLHF